MMIACPKCQKNDKVKQIQYGLISNPDEDAVLGGCIISNSNPKYCCVRCDFRFGLLSRFYELKINGELIAYAVKSFGRITITTKSPFQYKGIETYTAEVRSLKEASRLLGVEGKWKYLDFLTPDECFSYAKEHRILLDLFI